MKRIIALILTAALFSTSFVFADSSTNDPNTMYADTLKELGVFNGTDKGYELNRVPTRIEGAVMLVRLLGKEKEALAITKTLHPFKDIPAWADKYISYMYSSGLTKGKSATEFGSNDILSANQYATFLLRALGYDESADDFKWDKAMDKAYEINMIYEGEKNNILAKKNITRGDVVFLSYKALNTALKGTGKTLVVKLVDSGAIDRDKAISSGMYAKYGIYENEINLIDNYAYGNYANGRYALKYENDTYYSRDNYLIKKSADGSEKTITDKEVGSLFIEDGYAYYSAFSQYNGEIFRQNLATGEEQKLTNVMGLTPYVAGDWVYYRTNSGDWLTGYIYKMKKDGSENQKVSDVLVREFLVYDNRIFYVDKQWKLYSMNTDGSDVKVHTDSDIRNIFMADQWLFYISGSKDIKAVKIVQGEFTETRLIMGSINAISANLYNGWIYYVDDSDQYMLKKIKLDGSELVSIPSATNIEYINIVDGYLYYFKRNNEEIPSPRYRMKLDGTEDTRIDAPKPKVR